jgi:hypothetical protein
MTMTNPRTWNPDRRRQAMRTMLREPTKTRPEVAPAVERPAPDPAAPDPALLQAQAELAEAREVIDAARRYAYVEHWHRATLDQPDLPADVAQVTRMVWLAAKVDFLLKLDYLDGREPLALPRPAEMWPQVDNVDQEMVGQLVETLMGIEKRTWPTDRAGWLLDLLRRKPNG